MAIVISFHKRVWRNKCIPWVNFRSLNSFEILKCQPKEHFQGKGIAKKSMSQNNVRSQTKEYNHLGSKTWKKQKGLVLFKLSLNVSDARNSRCISVQDLYQNEVIFFMFSLSISSTSLSFCLSLPDKLYDICYVIACRYN